MTVVGELLLVGVFAAVAFGLLFDAARSRGRYDRFFNDAATWFRRRNVVMLATACAVGLVAAFGASADAVIVVLVVGAAISWFCARLAGTGLLNEWVRRWMGRQ